MDFISSKNIFLLTRDTLKLIDKRLMKHGSRTAYMVYKMLECKGGYEKFELAEFAMLATLHDIGAYKTDNLDDMLRFEMREPVSHSIYGYLFMNNLSPLKEKAKILLYHNSDYSVTKHLDFSYRDVANYINFAEKVDIYRNALGDKFDYSIFGKYEGTKYSQESIRLFSEAEETYHIFEKIQTDAYEAELDELMDYIMFTNEEKKQAMEMLMYCLSFRSKYKVVDGVTCVCICEEIAKIMGFSRADINKLYYGALIHDIGMLAISKSMIDSDKIFTSEERELMQTHVEVAENILSNRVDKDVVSIAVAHHERLNGKGYPKGLKSVDMNNSQKILQIADSLTAMINTRLYRQPMNRQEIINSLKEEADKKKLSREIVNIVIDNYDYIVGKAREQSEHMLKRHKHLNERFNQVYSNFKGKERG